MPLRLPDKWVWDFWLARDAQQHHVFYLQAPRSLRRSELRHHNASIGHAVSSDLRRWRVLPDALHPGPPGSWDDLATWTGSVIEHDGRWHMLYTGINRSEGGLIQRIGLAVSEDLTHWSKHPANPVLEADSRVVRAARSDALARPVLARPVAVRRPDRRRLPRPDHCAVAGMAPQTAPASSRTLARPTSSSGRSSRRSPRPASSPRSSARS